MLSLCSPSHSPSLVTLNLHQYYEQVTKANNRAVYKQNISQTATLFTERTLGNQPKLCIEKNIRQTATFITEH